MIGVYLYYSLLLVELLIILGVAFYMGSLVYSSLMGSPYVATKNKDVDSILQAAALKRGDFIIELGCGDGRFLIAASQKYKTRGLGVDVNPIVLFLATLKARKKNLSDVSFQRSNLFDVDLKQADVVYLFLMPELLEKLDHKLRHEVRASSLIISHGFKLDGWEKHLVKSLHNKPFPTYFYRRLAR